jgi:hypothetical protein
MYLQLLLPPAFATIPATRKEFIDIIVQIYMIVRNSPLHIDVSIAAF